MSKKNTAGSSLESICKYMSFDQSVELNCSLGFRKKGNKLFDEGKLFGAIAQYNKALVCARNHPELAALCYGNRSAVYLELKYFHHCLHNIDLAAPNFPDDKIQRLHHRRAKCLELMKTQADESLHAFDYKFELSYDANPKIPFFIDALELREDPENGKHMITTIDLKAGDVIAVIDKPWRSTVSNLNANFVVGCYTCGDTNNGDLIPGKCRVLFCSTKCMDQHDRENFNHNDFCLMENLHEDFVRLPNSSTINTSMLKFIIHMADVCGGANKLKKFVNDHRGKDYTVFDFDWSGDDDETRYKNMLLSMINASPKKKKVERTPEYLFKLLRPGSRIMAMICNKSNRELVNEVWKKTLHQNHYVPILKCTKMYNIEAYTHPALNLTGNHCNPNIVFHTNRQSVVFTVLHPMRAGSTIRSSSPPSQPYYAKNTGDLCSSSNPKSCEPCRDNWVSKLEDIRTRGTKTMCSMIHNFERYDSKQLSAHLGLARSCAKFINENYEKHFIDIAITEKIVMRMTSLAYILQSQIGNPFRISDIVTSMKLSEFLNADQLKLNQFFKKLEFESTPMDSSDLIVLG